MNVPVTLYRLALRLLPQEFRARYADEMLETFRARTAGTPMWKVTCAEIGDVVMTGCRLRTFRPVHATFAAAVIASAFLLLMYEPATSGTIDFSAADPAGEFTLTIREGKPVAASVDRVRVPASRLRQSGDSIRILEPNGTVLLTVAYYPERSRIEWAPREAR